ncbi:3-oxoacyl-[acyl-carrier protein] reductase [Lentzea albidocapillata subsp. violacea]|uniref:3-oxoacyl-[acyl-carrier protein] reductase n=1 Tax=Lentzea albidocapillata subsp. violacea TaxID=128104 RepID=A0A1G9G9C0_9PSEU|nr:SDR family NAD(P)-dependent oxidoreductase [Lentzea albidocapillata]SDK97165.1 3-oxoacyl-[acyl-carrier protein] reductase [Lentzea albidocapillata subsp. violacea]
MIDLNGKVVLVTGTSGTIGAGITQRFTAAGATVVHHRGLDDGDLRTSAERVVLQAFEQHGRLDAVVNNAGVQPVEPLPDMTTEQWRSVVDINLTGPFAVTQAAVAYLPVGGSVTHIASIEGTHPAPGHAHYAASKAALIMHARAAALEYGPRGIRVNTVSPGLIARPGIGQQWPEGVARWQAAAPLGRLGTPEDVGNACVFLASDLASWITGHNLVVDGGVTARPTW